MDEIDRIKAERKKEGGPKYDEKQIKEAWKKAHKIALRWKEEEEENRRAELEKLLWR